MGNTGRELTKDLIQLLQRQTLRLRQKQQHRHEPHNIPPGIPAKRPRRRKRSLQTRVRNRQHKIKEPRRRRRETHSQRPNIQRIRFRGIRKRYGPFTGGVNDSEEIDSQGDTGDARGVMRAVGDKETEAGEEEEEGHEWESGEEEVSAAEGVDGVDGWDGEEEVNYPEAEGCGEGGDGGELGFEEDGGGVICYDVYAAELLHEHDL